MALEARVVLEASTLSVVVYTVQLSPLVILDLETRISAVLELVTL